MKLGSFGCILCTEHDSFIFCIKYWWHETIFFIHHSNIIVHYTWRIHGLEPFFSCSRITFGQTLPSFWLNSCHGPMAWLQPLPAALSVSAAQSLFDSHCLFTYSLSNVVVYEKVVSFHQYLHIHVMYFHRCGTFVFTLVPSNDSGFNLLILASMKLANFNSLELVSTVSSDDQLKNK